MSQRLSPERLDRIFSEWVKIKAQKSLLEKREADIKEIINDIMREEGKVVLSTENYHVSKIKQHRTGITKGDVPEDIWTRYSKRSEFDAFRLKRLN